MKKALHITKRIIKWLFIAILLLISILLLHDLRIISIGQRSFVKRTDYGDELLVKVQPYDFTTVFNPGCARTVFEIKGKEETDGINYFFFPEPFNAKDIDIEFLFGGENLRYYKLNFDFSCYDVTMYETPPDYLVIDETNDIWDVRTRDSTMNDYREEFYPLAKYYFLQGEQDWIIYYGNKLVNDGDKKALEIISSIADGITEPHGVKFSDEEVYNKCVELKNKVNGTNDDAQRYGEAVYNYYQAFKKYNSEVE